MAGGPSGVGAITLFVADPRRSKAFYGRVFERPVVHEDGDSVALRFENLILNCSPRAPRPR
jgi:catechol 2,3-dioxygenase-like lactoylglutathione lyase family enzyme